MWGPWRLTLRKAEHALKIGRLDEAVAYVSRPEVRSYRQARELKVRVAEALAGRAAEHLRTGDSQRAWNDIDQAQSLDGAHDRIGEVRQQLVRLGLDEATQYINAGQPEAALTALDKLAKRGVNEADARRIHEAAAAWRTGRDQARLGRLPAAVEQFEMARAFLPDCEPLENALQQAWAARDRLATLETELHRTLASEDWPAALGVADEILGIAPEHVQARAARRRAWQAVGAPVSNVGGRRQIVAGEFRRGQGEPVTVIRPPGSPAADAPHPGPLSPTAGEMGRGEGLFEEPPAQQSGQRFLLWIDGVGGYLVCLGERVSIGQPAGWHVDVPIMADLSRLHAWIERDGEGYSLRAVRPAVLGGRSVREKAVLGDDVQIVLGQGTRLRFRQPNPLSRTARLDIESPHRLSLPAEAVVLMAETCIISAKTNSHIVATGWKTEVVLFRQGDELWCRVAGDFSIDDVACHDRGRLTLSSRIKGDGFSLALEPLEVNS